MGLINKVKKMFKTKKVTLVYNERQYEIEANKLNLNGSGRIEIYNQPNYQQSKITGNFLNIKVNQENEKTYVNGIDIEEFVKNLEAQK